ncbi:MAG: cadherin-like domain-containing protein [Isosphaeraceae bacterium]
MLNLINSSRVRRRAGRLMAAAEPLEPRTLLAGAFWQGFARDAQHSALSTVKSLPLSVIRWQTPVDLQPQYTGDDLWAHYGSPVVTAAGTAIIPVKTGTSGGFRVEARQVTDGTLNWSLTTDYILPSYRWVPVLQPTLTPFGQLNIPAAGGTVLRVADADVSGTPAATRVAFYGIDNYSGGTQNSTVYINTPITSDAAGNLYFGFLASSGNGLGLRSGIARIGADGQGSWVGAATVSEDASISQVPTNSAPALSADGTTLYVAVSTGDRGRGYLLALNSQTLALRSKVALKDPSNGNDAALSNDATSSPMVAPDGDVYFGVLGNPTRNNEGRGWLLHFSGDLRTTKAPGGFGWDVTPSLVPASMVPSYHGAATYFLMVKYNSYPFAGGDAIHKIAILDPTETMVDPGTGVSWMCPELTIAAPTPDPEYSQTHPGAVREWCINTAAVDPLSNSILANCEDGKLYRWNLVTNTLTESVVLTDGIGEAYTPTVIANDGTVFAVNNATLFAVGKLATNNAPKAVDDAYLAVRDSALTVGASTGVLDNDTDIDGDTLAAALAGQPAHGTVTLNANGSFTYTPEAGYVGEDSFTYRNSDGTLTSNVATVRIKVVKVYVPPSAGDDSYSTGKGQELVVPAPGILANDFHPEGGSLLPVLAKPPSRGSVRLLGGGGFLYGPNPGFSGVDTFQYKVTDGVGMSNVATVQIRVVDNSAPPIVTALPLQVEQGTLLQGVLVGTILVGDPAQASKAYSAVINWGDGTPVSNATVSSADAQLFNINAIHVYDRVGTYTYTITVRKGFDGSGGSITTEGTVVVSPLTSGLSGAVILPPAFPRTPDGTPVLTSAFATVAGSAPPGWQVQVIAWPRGIIGSTTAGPDGRFQLGVSLPEGSLAPSLEAVNLAARAAGSQLSLNAALGNLVVDTTSPVIQSVRLATRAGQILVTFREAGSGMDGGRCSPRRAILSSSWPGGAGARWPSRRSSTRAPPPARGRGPSVWSSTVGAGSTPAATCCGSRARR